MAEYEERGEAGGGGGGSVDGVYLRGAGVSGGSSHLREDGVVCSR